ncbi:hypothetical protein ACSS6W_001945 [Trichoderma asperelloides]
MPQTPPQAPQGRNRSTAVDDSFLLSLLQTPSLISLYKNASYQGTSRSLPVSPERPSASNLDPLSLSLPLPSPVFCSESTPHWSNENPQIRPLPQAQVPPPTEPLPRAEASTSSSSPQKKTPLKPMQSQPFNHPNPLGSNPPQGPATTMEQNPQPTFVPSSAPVSRVQGALQSGNPIQAGMQRRPDDLRQPRQLPLPQRQPDHHVPQGGQQYNWNFPGREIIPPARNNPPLDGQWMTGEFLWIRVGGKSFRLPTQLLSEYPFWFALTVFEPPPQGWSIPDVNPEIFTILLECVYTICGLHGTESGLNLVKLCYAVNLAKRWGMIEDRKKLRDTAYRYIVRRVMHYDPNVPDDCRALDHRHYTYRSEELYRTWELSRKHNSIQKMLTQHDLIALYCCIIPQDIWPTLTARFKQEFTMLLDISATARRNSAGVTANADYRSWWHHYYRLAGFRDASWLSPDAQNRLFEPLGRDGNDASRERAEFEAARARGSALVNALEAQQAQQQPVTPASLGIPSVVEEVDAGFENNPPSAHRRENRRVHFAQLPEIIRFSRQHSDIQTSAPDTALDPAEEEAIHAEAARAG